MAGNAFGALTLLVGWQEEHPACKKTEWWGAGVVICLERGADLHMAQLMPLPLIVSCSSKIQIGAEWYRLTRIVPENGCVRVTNQCIGVSAAIGVQNIRIDDLAKTSGRGTPLRQLTSFFSFLLFFVFSSATKFGEIKIRISPLGIHCFTAGGRVGVLKMQT